VNEWLPSASVDLRGPAARFTVYAPIVMVLLCRLQTPVAANHHSRPICDSRL
jgi:hypothetical protein